MKDFYILSIAFMLICFDVKAQNVSVPIVDAHCHIKTVPSETLFPTIEEYFMDNESINVKYLFGVTIAERGNIAKTMIVGLEP